MVEPDKGAADRAIVTVGPVALECVTRLSWAFIDPATSHYRARLVWLVKAQVTCSKPDAQRGDLVTFTLSRGLARWHGLA
jgi:hypothetical protein